MLCVSLEGEERTLAQFYEEFMKRLLRPRTAFSRLMGAKHKKDKRNMVVKLLRTAGRRGGVHLALSLYGKQ